MTTRILELKHCRECPHCDMRHMPGHDASDWHCLLAKRVISTYIEYQSDEPKEIPKWCPLPKKQ